MIKIGDEYGGGIIFHLDEGNMSGLIAAKQNLPGKYSYYEAIGACNNCIESGYDDWRLPSKWEWSLLCKQENILGTDIFLYTSSTEHNKYTAWIQYFDGGGRNQSKNGAHYVRAIRSFSIDSGMYIAPKKSLCIGQEYNGGILFYVNRVTKSGLIAQKKDLPSTYTLYTATKACQESTENGYTDWYLPDIEELNLLRQQKNKVGGFITDFYCSSTLWGTKSVYFQNFRTGTIITVPLDNGSSTVRAIRNVTLSDLIQGGE